MNSGSKQIIVKLLSLFVAFSGILVMIGWIFKVDLFLKLHPAWTSMKFGTAIAFLLSGITLFFIVKALEDSYDLAQVVLFTTSLFISLIMGIFLLSAIFGIHTGLEDFFISDKQLDPKTVIPGRPSVPTMINFLLISLAGILTIINTQELRLKLRTIGFSIGLIGILAVSGYLANLPLLYYYLPGLNTAMAFNSAALFVLLGTGLLCL